MQESTFAIQLYETGVVKKKKQKVQEFELRYTHGARTAVLAHRPAPVQVMGRSYLTQNVFEVVWQKSVPAQIRHLIPYYYPYNE